MRTILLVLVLVLGYAPAAADSTGREAGRHFQRGVELYNDGDFRGALVEFKRAYKLLPRASVLYDIGETEFQLQDYAASLVTMRRFLAETGPSAAHRTEVETTVETLQGRVGRVALAVELSHCEVSIDDQAVGVTPLAEPVLVSIGTRRLLVACPDRPTAQRRLEVSAGELVRIELPIGPPLTPAHVGVAATIVRPSRESLRQRRLAQLAGAWVATGLLAGATLAVGTATLVESAQLSSLRDTYPAMPSELSRKGALVHGLSIAADTVGIAALAALGVSTWVTVRHYRERSLMLSLSPTVGGLAVQGRF